jgi:hypothetical protein
MTGIIADRELSRQAMNDEIARFAKIVPFAPFEIEIELVPAAFSRFRIRSSSTPRRGVRNTSCGRTPAA